MRIRNLLCALLLLALCLLSGCWQEEPPAEEDPGFLPAGEESASSGSASSESAAVLPTAFSLPYVPGQTLDPITCSDGMQWTVSSLLYEGLFHLNESLEPEPLLCESYTRDDAALTYTFTLKSGLVFTDGSEVTGKDVKATLDRARSSERYGARLSQVSKITASGNTVTVSLRSANTALPALLDIPIVKSGTEEDTVPVGTGPYLYSDSGGEACLTASQLWHGGLTQPVDRIVLTEAADQDTLLYRFSSHDVQLITADLTGSSPISVSGEVSYQDADTTIFQFLGCNTAREPLSSASLRRALHQSINRTQIVSAFLSGHGAAAQFPLSPVSSLYPAELEERYAPDALAAELSASGYTAERTLTLLVNSENSFKISIAEDIADTLTAAGLPVVVRSLPWAEYSAALAAGSFDLYYGEVRLTADWDLRALLSTGGSLNRTGWADERTDQLLSAFMGASDRAAAAKELCAYLLEQSPILPVCFKSTSVLTQSGVIDGLSPTMTEPFYGLERCTIHLR